MAEKTYFSVKKCLLYLVQSGKVTELLLYFSSTFFIINKLVSITTCPQHDQAYLILTYTGYAITRNIQTQIKNRICQRECGCI